MAPANGDASGMGSTRRGAIRVVTVTLAAAVAVLYIVVFFVQLPHLHEPDNPAPVYLVLALLYAAGAVLVALRDKPVVHWVGAAVQVILVGLFLWLLAGLYAHGEESFILDMAALAIAITAVQVVLLGLLIHLAMSDQGRPPGAVQL